MNKLIFLDTETTGNDVTKDRLCQVCYKYEDYYRVGFFKPPVPISVKAMSITHITNKMVEDKEPFADSTMRKELQELLDEGILVAHNAPFDKAILEVEGMTIPRYICTFRVARSLDEDAVIPEYNLQYLRYYLDLDIVDANAHDAEGDVKVLAALFDRLFAKLKATGLSDDEAIERMIAISTTPILFKKFQFGKHNGEMIADVAKTDRGYLQWLLGQKMAEGVVDEDWVHTLQTYLQ